MQRRFAAILVAGAAAAALTGCTGSSRSARLAVAPKPGAGGSWNAVLPAATIAAAGTESLAADGWILTRNDSSLNPRTFGPVLATAEWPEPERPSVRRPVLIRVYEQPGRYYSYGPGARRYYDSTRRSTGRRY